MTVHVPVKSDNSLHFTKNDECKQTQQLIPSRAIRISMVVEHLPHHLKVEGSCPTAATGERKAAMYVLVTVLC
jgi:hypothetical protein